MQTIWPIEINITLFFQSLGLWLKPIFSTITFLGSEEFYMVVIPALYWCIDSALGIRVGIILLLGDWSNNLLKWLGTSPRPYWIDPRVKALASETGFGMPSGHSMKSASIFGLIGIHIHKTWSIIAAIIVILLVGISRIYLGVHFTSDVVVGWLLGGLLLLAFILFEKPVTAWLKNLRLGAQLGVAIGSSLLMIATSIGMLLLRQGWSVPSEWLTNALNAGAEAPSPLATAGLFTTAGTWLGMTCGFIMLHRLHGSMDVTGSFWQRLLRFAIGLIGTLILWKGLGALLPSDPIVLGSILRYLRYTLVGLWVAWWAPVIFVKLNLAKYH